MKFLVLVIIASVLLANYNVKAEALDYGIMIDAGSSGSRIYLYSWAHRDNNTLPIVAPYFINQTAISLKVNPGLSSYANNVSAAGPSLAPLIAYIKGKLDQRLWSVTPIYLKATAGLRALSQSSQDAIIANVRTYLTQTGFEFSPEYAEVINGTVEGEFGWITTNYVFQILQQNNPSNSYGALDMGGASTQITFTPATAPTQYKTALALAGSTYSLYAYSYPLGQDATLALILASLVQTQTSAANFTGNVITNPCYLKGYNETYAASIASYVIVGTANYSACSDLVLSLVIQKNSSCANCGLRSVYQPPPFGHFVTFSGFAYTGQFYGINDTGTPAMYQSGAQSFCSTPWTSAVQNNPTVTVSLLKLYCYTGAYFYNLLTTGYGFSPSANLSVLTTVGGIEISWTLGGMIYEASLLPFGPLNITTTTSTTGSISTSTTGASSTTTGAASTSTTGAASTTTAASAVSSTTAASSTAATTTSSTVASTTATTVASSTADSTTSTAATTTATTAATTAATTSATTAATSTTASASSSTAATTTTVAASSSVTIASSTTSKTSQAVPTQASLLFSALCVVMGALCM